MSLEYLSVLLRCHENVDAKVPPPTLIDRLYPDGPGGCTALQLEDLEFLPEDNEPYEPFEADVRAALEKLAGKIEAWPSGVFEEWRAKGGFVDLTLQIGHGDGRFIVNLPPRLIAACDRLRLPLRIDAATHDDWFP